MKIDNHVHIGVDPLFYYQGWSPYCLDLIRLMEEAGQSGIDAWIVFPFVSYLALDQHALRNQVVELSRSHPEVPYSFENRRLCDEIMRSPESWRSRFWPFLMADPSRLPREQVKEWKRLPKDYPVYGIKIQATIIKSPILALLEEGACMLDYAEEHNLPFLIHSSINPNDVWSQCSDILKVAEARPGIRFLLAHSCRFHEPSLKRIAELPNTWFDCSAHIIHCQCAVRNLPTVAVPKERFSTDYTSPQTVLRDLAEAYPDKLIWGSDAPFYSYEDQNIQLRCSYAEEISCLNSLPEHLLERVAHRNTLAWLGRDK